MCNNKKKNCVLRFVKFAFTLKGNGAFQQSAMFAHLQPWLATPISAEVTIGQGIAITRSKPSLCLKKKKKKSKLCEKCGWVIFREWSIFRDIMVPKKNRSFLTINTLSIDGNICNSY